MKRAAICICLLLLDICFLNVIIIEKNEAAAAFSHQETEVKGKLAITFDDGPHPVYTEILLDGLKERGIPATFFVTGAHAEEYPKLIKRMHEEGHLIGNHTYSHLEYTTSNHETFKSELLETNAILKEITGKEPEFIRPPYGSWEKSFEKELNMFPVLWTVEAIEMEIRGK